MVGAASPGSHSTVTGPDLPVLSCSEYSPQKPTVLVVGEWTHLLIGDIQSTFKELFVRHHVVNVPVYFQVMRVMACPGRYPRLAPNS